MNENTINIQEEEFEQTEEAAQETFEEKITPEYILESVAEIIRRQKYIQSVIAQLENLGPEAAIALSRIVEKHETTNQKLIEFYKRDMSKLLIEEIKKAEDADTKNALSSALRDLFVGW